MDGINGTNGDSIGQILNVNTALDALRVRWIEASRELDDARRNLASGARSTEELLAAVAAERRAGDLGAAYKTLEAVVRRLPPWG